MAHQKRTILSRLLGIFRTNAHSALDAVEARDTPKMLDRAVADYEDQYKASTEAVAKVVGNLALTKRRHADAVAEVSEWGTKAAMASDRADELGARGDETGRARYDALAEEALRRKIVAEKDVQRLAADINSEQMSVNQLRIGLQNTERNLHETRRRRDALKNDLRVADTKIELQRAANAVSGADPTSVIARAEETVAQRQALAAGVTEMAASSLESQFAGMERDLEGIEASSQLRELKERRKADKEIGS